MNLKAEALSYYYKLLAEGKSTTQARGLVYLKHRVLITKNVPSPNFCVSDPVPPREPMEFGGDFCKTVQGTSTGPQDGLRRGA